ncbi:MAG: GTPase [Candidatus Woesearchaeota archaeon]|jgi:nucleolar GTP-binding protein
MNFQDLVKIESHTFYLDVAFNAAKKGSEKLRLERFRSKIIKSKSIEIERLNAISRSLSGSLSNIIKKYPSINSLPEFYQELITTLLDSDQIRKALSRLNFVTQKIPILTNMYRSKIKNSTQIDEMNRHRREYYGRISSLLKDIKEELELLEIARRELKKFPAIKTNIKTICICGFPNVGKSTLLKKLTGSNVEISAYAFTTKQLLIGYMELYHHKLQLIDSPGVLNRENKENIIEHQAYLAVKYLADYCLFVIDITAGSQYSIKDQMRLFSDLKKRFNKDFIVYISKTDILEKSKIEEFLTEFSKNKDTKDDLVFTDTIFLSQEMEKRIKKPDNKY